MQTLSLTDTETAYDIREAAEELARLQAAKPRPGVTNGVEAASGTALEMLFDGAEHLNTPEARTAVFYAFVAAYDEAIA